MATTDPHVGGIPVDDPEPTRSPLGPAALEDAAYWAALARSAAHNAIGAEDGPEEMRWLIRSRTWADLAAAHAAIAQTAATADLLGLTGRAGDIAKDAWREVLSP
jgi:hypothetical protein